MTLIPPEIHLVDGENLVARFQAMKAQGYKVRPEVVHVPDVLVWTPTLFASVVAEIRRISYYTSVVGDDLYLASIEKQIRGFNYSCRDGLLHAFSTCRHAYSRSPAKVLKLGQWTSTS